jgi:hypothetical protein
MRASWCCKPVCNHIACTSYLRGLGFRNFLRGFIIVAINCCGSGGRVWKGCFMIELQVPIIALATGLKSTRAHHVHPLALFQQKKNM